MNTGFPPPYQNSVVSAYLLSDRPGADVQDNNPGSVLKPVEEAREAAPSQDKPRTGAADNDQNRVLQEQQQNQRQQQLESRQIEVEQQQIQQLAARDREVRNHERAHAAVGGQYAGAPRYQYQRGPDGINYAVAGEVAISAGPVAGDPQATIDKAQVVRRAALAPAEPSAQDRRVAAQATQMEVKARADLAEMQRQERLESEAVEEQDATGTQQVQETQEGNALNAQRDDADASEREQQRQNLNQLSTELSRRLVDSDIASQAPRPGQIISSFA